MYIYIYITKYIEVLVAATTDFINERHKSKNVVPVYVYI